MADQSIFNQPFDDLLKSVGVESENQTETTNAPNQAVETEQVAEAAEKVETVAKKEESKEKTTEDYRVDLDVLGGAADDETLAQSEPPVEPSTNVDNAETTKAVSKDAKVNKPELDVWGDPISALSNETKTTNPFDAIEATNQDNTQASVWNGPAQPTNNTASASQSNIWSGPTDAKSEPKETASPSQSNIWGETTDAKSEPKETVTEKAEVKAKPKAEVKAKAKPKEAVAKDEPKEVVAKDESKEVVAKDEPKEVVAKDESKEVVAKDEPKAVKGKKPATAKNKKSSAKSAEQSDTFDLSVELPTAIIALFGGEKDHTFSEIEAKAKAFILQEVKSAAKNMVEKQFIEND